MNETDKQCDSRTAMQGQVVKTNDTWMRDRFTEKVEEIFNSCKELIIKKNSDYTKLNESDPFFNFRQECVDLFLSNTNINDKVDGITLGLITRLNDKRRRRENLLLTSGLLVIDETIEDTIKDEINYLVILLCHLKMHGRHKVNECEKAEPTEITWQERELNNRNAQITQLHAEIRQQREHNTILVKRLEEKNVRRNRKSK